MSERFQRLLEDLEALAEDQDRIASKLSVDQDDEGAGFRIWWPYGSDLMDWPNGSSGRWRPPLLGLAMDAIGHRTQ